MNEHLNNLNTSRCVLIYENWRNVQITIKEENGLYKWRITATLEGYRTARQKLGTADTLKLAMQAVEDNLRVYFGIIIN